MRRMGKCQAVVTIDILSLDQYRPSQRFVLGPCIKDWLKKAKLLQGFVWD